MNKLVGVLVSELSHGSKDSSQIILSNVYNANIDKATTMKISDSFMLGFSLIIDFDIGI